MADYSKYSNYTEETSFSEVIFAADSPLLEVEANELQQIFNTKYNRLVKQLGDGVFPDDETDYISFDNSNKTVTLYNIVVLSKNGLSVRVNNSKVTVPNSTGTFYLLVRMKETEVTYQSVLKSYGDTEGNQIANKIKDPRWSNETSRRKVTEFTLMCSKNIPRDMDGYVYVLVGSFKWENSEFSEWSLNSSNISQLDKIANQTLINKNKINALGQLGDYVDFVSGQQAGTYTWSNLVSTKTSDFDADFKVYQKCDFFDDVEGIRSKVFAIANLPFSISIAGKNGSDLQGRRFKVTCTLEIGSGYLYNESYQQNPAPNINNAFFRRYYNFTQEVFAGEFGVDSNPVKYRTVKEVSIMIPLGRSLAPYQGSNGLIIWGQELHIYEYDMNSDQWVDADLTKLDASEVMRLQGMGGYIYFVKLGKNLDAYGADEAFDDIIVDYNKLTNKPQINDVTLIGNKTSADLHIQGGSGSNDYEALENLPTLNGSTIIGDMVETDPVYTNEKMTDEEVEDMLDDIFGGE